MRYYLFLILLFLVVFPKVFSQVKPRKLPVIINHPSLNLYAPYISVDGNALVFISDNAEDFVLTLFYTSKENADWKEPVALPKIINSRLNFLRGVAFRKFIDRRVRQFDQQRNRFAVRVAWRGRRGTSNGCVARGC